MPVLLHRGRVGSGAAAKARDPQRNVPRITILGALLAAGVHLLSLVAIFGIIPNAQLQFALGAYVIGLPVYWLNRRHMTAPGPVPPSVEVRPT